MQVFANSLSADTKVSKTQLSKVMQLGEFVIQDIQIFGNFLSDAAKVGTDIARNDANNR